MRRVSDAAPHTAAQPHDLSHNARLLPPLQSDTSLTPNAFSWSSAIAACERAGEWQKGAGDLHGPPRCWRAHPLG